MDSSFISKYCQIRLVSGSVIAGIFGIILFFVSIFASRIVGDTSSYILTDATVKDAEIKQYTSGGSSSPTVYNVIYIVEYIVDNKKYTGAITERFISVSQAARVLGASKGSTKKIYYDPLSPDKNSESKSTESILRWSSFGMSILLIGYAIVAFILRNNQAMCAITTLGNITR